MLNVKIKVHMRHVSLIRLVLATILLAFALPGVVTYGAPSAAPLRDKDVKRAEKIIAKLQRLEEAVASSVDFRTYRAEISRLYPELFVDASELRDSDLKTDLTTAVFLYEYVYRSWTASDARTPACGEDLRGAYLKLCRESRGGSHARFFWSKARLHTRWAGAAVRSHRGAADSVTLMELSEMRAAREDDLMLAEQAVGVLRKLGGRLNGHQLMAESDGARAGATVAFNQLSEEVDEALSSVDAALASLPRGPLYVLLHNARSSFRDGLFWWGKIYQRREMTVSVNSLVATDPLKVTGLDAGTVNRTVLGNWSAGVRYTEEAEKTLNALKLRPHDGD